MNTTLIKFARFYASTKHVGQLYNNALPYTQHLEEVEDEVRMWFPYFYDQWWPFTYDSGWDIDFVQEQLIVVAWLHDVVEDCRVDIKEIEELFGYGIAYIVNAVTNQPGKNRAERNAATYPKILQDSRAVFIKLCDRLANVYRAGTFKEMYKKEYPDFRAALYIKGMFDVLWQNLDRIMEYIPNQESQS